MAKKNINNHVYRCLSNIISLYFVFAVLLTPPTHGQTQDCTIISPNEVANTQRMLESSAVTYRIKEINIQQKSIFDTTQEQESLKIHRAANLLHINTKENVILRQLRIQPGDIYQQEMIQAAERQLRANSYLSKVSIIPHEICKEAIEEERSVSLTVITHEVWSIIPGASYTNIDDESTIDLSITDVNFLGRGEQLSFGYTKHEDENSFRTSYSAPYLINDSFDLFASLSNGEQFKARRLNIIQPFRNIHSTRAMGLTLSTAEFEQNRYLRTQAIYSYDVSREYAQLFWGTSKGLVNGKINRLEWGLTLDHRTFDNIMPIGAEPLSNREREYPWFSISQFTHEFLKIKNLRHMHRVEDLFVGFLWNVRLGYANDSSNDETDYLEFNTNLRDTPIHTQRHIFQWQWSLNNSWATELNHRENFLTQLRLAYYLMHGHKQRSVLIAQRSLGRSLTVDQLLTQGGNRGLRGYPRFYQLGNEQYSINLEHRYYFDWEFLSLFQFAAVVYADAGRAWFSEPSLGFTDYAGDETLWNLGFGLRISSNRTGLSSIAHIDVAFPMTDPPILGTGEPGEAFDQSRFTLELKSYF